MPRGIWSVLILFCLVFSSSFQLLTLLTNGPNIRCLAADSQRYKIYRGNILHSPLLELYFAVSPIALVLEFLDFPGNSNVSTCFRTN